MSAAALPDVRNRPAPYTPAAPPTSMPAALPAAAPFPTHNTPPGICPPPVPPLPLRSPLSRYAPTAGSQSLPARSGSPLSSPAGPLFPGTRYCHPPTIAPCHPSCRPCPRPYTDLKQTSLRSAPRCSDIPDPPLLPRYKVPRLSLPAPYALPDPPHTAGYSRSACRSEPAPPPARPAHTHNTIH